MTMSSPIPVLCLYRVKPGKEAELVKLLEKHWPALAHAGLVTGEPSRVLRGQDRSKKTCYVELFSWKDARAPETAHRSADVMAVWGPMGPLCDGMEFLHTEQVPMPWDAERPRGAE